MRSLFISTILSNTDDWYYKFFKTLYSFESLEDIINKTLKSVKVLSSFEKSKYQIIINHFVEDYNGNDLYLKMVQKFNSAIYRINLEGDIIESQFGIGKDFILSDFTEPENKFSIGDICEIYIPSDKGTSYFGTGVITRLRQDMNEINIDNPYSFNPGYWMSFICTSEGNVTDEDFGYAQEWLRKVETPRDHVGLITEFSKIVKENKIDFRDYDICNDLINRLIKE